MFLFYVFIIVWTMVAWTVSTMKVVSPYLESPSCMVLVSTGQKNCKTGQAEVNEPCFPKVIS